MKYSLIFSSLLLSVSFGGESVDVQQDSRYYFVTREATFPTPPRWYAMTWSEAQQECQNRYGTDLASIHSEAQNEAVMALYEAATCKSSEKAFIGARNTGSGFANVDGSSYNYENWAPLQPMEGEGYVTVDDNGMWEDWDDQEGWECFVCNKIDPTPAPSAATNEPTGNTSPPTPKPVSPTNPPVPTAQPPAPAAPSSPTAPTVPTPAPVPTRRPTRGPTDNDGGSDNDDSDGDENGSTDGGEKKSGSSGSSTIVDGLSDDTFYILIAVFGVLLICCTCYICYRKNKVSYEKHPEW